VSDTLQHARRMPPGAQRFRALAKADDRLARAIARRDEASAEWAAAERAEWPAVEKDRAAAAAAILDGKPLPGPEHHDAAKARLAEAQRTHAGAEAACEQAAAELLQAASQGADGWIADLDRERDGALKRAERARRDLVAALAEAAEVLSLARWLDDAAAGALQHTLYVARDPGVDGAIVAAVGKLGAPLRQDRPPPLEYRPPVRIGTLDVSTGAIRAGEPFERTR
jgi:hypothetical protein